MNSRPLLAVVLGLLLSGCGSDSAPDPGPRYRRGVHAMESGRYAEAYCLWKPLADAGHAGSQYSIGWMFANGRGMAMDEAEALRWWRMAAQHGHADAQFAVARVLLYGEGVEEDPAAAVPWLERAARQGVEEAREILRDMAGRGVEPAQSRVKELLGAGGWEELGGVRRVQVDRANVRARRGQDQRLVTALDQGAVVLALRELGDWVQVGIPGSGALGWIYHPLLEPAEEP